MAHELDTSNDRNNIAFLGSRNNVWHRLGQEMLPGMSIPAWAKAAGLEWTAIKVPAMAQLPDGTMRAVEGQRFLCRSDTGKPLGYVSESYQTVQPVDVLNWFRDYVLLDDRFQLDVAGSLRDGQTIWATARYVEDLTVAGDHHSANVLMTTTYDGSGATVNQATTIRTVCANTLRVATSDKRAVIRSTHGGKFNPARVASELATIAQSFQSYKAMGDALALVAMSVADVSNFFKAVLDIPFDAKRDDISTRKFNQFEDLNAAYKATVAEGTPALTGWAALNSVTRYVDHTRTARASAANGSAEVARFMSANFGGSGDQLKGKAVTLLRQNSQLPDSLRLLQTAPVAA